ncbi:uncharacterized protein LOC120627122 [Pararge aegeria]|uniref:uncharacterized protein LOC120627122 n=1 Tax=Pararge aegeria TaxID=116150 RepID=UPI0019CFC9D3|nr:uncharacterized protein LOC120627122 [Pararge aegeria]
MQKCLEKLPKVEKCCICITDLKVAAAIIAVLGIVTSPMVSWVVVRHMYVIKVSCVLNTNSSRPDVVDILMTNALSFGFGVSSGLGSSCLSSNATGSEEKSKSSFKQVVRGTGWIVLISDGVFVISSIHFLIKMFKGVDKRSSLIFIIAGFISIFFSFTYGMLYVAACVYLGGLFPIFEFFFACFDLIIWIYYLMVVYSFRQKTQMR